MPETSASVTSPGPGPAEHPTILQGQGCYDDARFRAEMTEAQTGEATCQGVTATSPPAPGLVWALAWLYDLEPVFLPL